MRRCTKCGRPHDHRGIGRDGRSYSRGACKLCHAAQIKAAPSTQLIEFNRRERRRERASGV